MLLGGYAGQLNDSQDRVELQRPGQSSAAEPTLVPRIVEDQIAFHDQTPWPAADCTGRSLLRRDGSSSGLDARSWVAGVASPGIYLPTSGDFNGDHGRVHIADVDALCAAIRQQDQRGDINGDGRVTPSDLLDYTEQTFGSTAGDANLDGVFNSRDFVQIFQLGEYEDGVAGELDLGRRRLDVRWRIRNRRPGAPRSKGEAIPRLRSPRRLLTT